MGLDLFVIQTDASEFRMKQRRRRLLWESRRPRPGRHRLEIDPDELHVPNAARHRGWKIGDTHRSAPHIDSVLEDFGLRFTSGRQVEVPDEGPTQRKGLWALSDWDLAAG